MTDEQIYALTEYVRAAVRAAVAEAKDSDNFGPADRLDDAERRLVELLKAAA
jgi:hypothetical protein